MAEDELAMTVEHVAAHRHFQRPGALDLRALEAGGEYVGNLALIGRRSGKTAPRTLAAIDTPPPSARCPRAGGLRLLHDVEHRAARLAGLTQPGRMLSRRSEVRSASIPTRLSFSPILPITLRRAADRHPRSRPRRSGLHRRARLQSDIRVALLGLR
jgi:hypothetical protein